jgi:hypothetical protein
MSFSLSYFSFFLRPGELNRLSADGSILLKNGGAGGYGVGFMHHQTSPAFQNHHQQQQQQQQLSSHNVASPVGQHPSQLHQSSQQTAAALMMNGKSPSRDLGGGSTPVLKMTAAHNNNTATAQVMAATLLCVVHSFIQWLIFRNDRLKKNNKKIRKQENLFLFWRKTKKTNLPCIVLIRHEGIRQNHNKKKRPNLSAPLSNRKFPFLFL